MKISLIDTNENINISDKIFNYPLNMSLIHQVVRSYRINSRKGNVSQKSRSDVKGSNKKPWRQKGTGRSRAGSLKSPLWRSGGVTFASKPKEYCLKINKKMYFNAFKSVFSQLFRENRIYVISDINLNSYKTKLFINKFSFVKLYKLLIVIKEYNNFLYLSSRNIYNVNIFTVNNINIIDLINSKNVIFTLNSIMFFEDKFING